MHVMDRRQFQLLYKGNKCAYCGVSVLESYQRYGTFHRMYEFNHVDPAKKDPDYDNLIRRNISVEQLDELDKCVLLCRQCHGILHAQDLVTTMTITVKVLGQSAEQTFKGQMIFDRVDNKLGFFTDDELLVLPYWLTLGDDPARLLFGKELKNTLMSEWVPLTKERGPLLIENAKRDGLFGAKRHDEEHVEIEHDCRFSLFPFRFDPSPDQTVLMRNGVALIRNGTEWSIHNRATGRGVTTYEELQKRASDGVN
jgi:hypothetical protein